MTDPPKYYRNEAVTAPTRDRKGSRITLPDLPEIQLNVILQYMADIADNLIKLMSRVRELETRHNRYPGSVKVLAVSKARTNEEIRLACSLGQKHFGENYLQEAVTKIEALKDLDVTWHFIGPIQSNKTRHVAENFSWVHSVDRLKIAQRLNAMRPGDKPALNVCIQINISDESTKSGIHPDELDELASEINNLPNLRLRGLMTMPGQTDNIETQRTPFRKLYEYFLKLNNDQLNLDTLSMGTSGDMEAAIAEGSTILRIGTAIFGARHHVNLS